MHLSNFFNCFVAPSLSSLSTIWVKSPTSIRCVFCKKFREILCSYLGQAKFSHPTHYTHTYLHLWLCTWGGLRELNMHINNEHDRHIVLMKSWQRNYENSYHFACYKKLHNMNAARNQKWNPSKNHTFSWLKSTAITIASLQFEVKKMCQRSVKKSVKTKGNILAGAK